MGPRIDGLRGFLGFICTSSGMFLTGSALLHGSVLAQAADQAHSYAIPEALVVASFSIIGTALMTLGAWLVLRAMSHESRLTGLEALLPTLVNDITIIKQRLHPEEE